MFFNANKKKLLSFIIKICDISHKFHLKYIKKSFLVIFIKNMDNLIQNLSIKYEKPERFLNKKLSYGTAGFRFK